MVKKRKFLGFGFSDEVAKVTFKSSQFKKGTSHNWQDFLIPNFRGFDEKLTSKSFWMTTIFSAFCLIIFFIFFLRLFHLQIAQGKINRNLADGNRIQIKVIHAPRGVIYDRNGKILAANSPAFRLVDKDTKKAKLISREEALNLEVKNDPRVQELEIDNVRTYPLGEKAAHVVGFVGEISEEELKMGQYSKYRAGDRIGKAGIEAQYEKILKGVDGGEIIEVDSTGQKIRTLRRNAPVPGQNVYLTLDSDLQSRVYDLTEASLTKVGSCCGAVVASDPSNGQILSLVSFPSFDPNIVTSSQDEVAISQIFSHPDSPTLDRVIGGVYPPGSTYKIVSSLAALASGKISPQTTFQDNGVIYIDTFKFTNWYFNQYGKTEGAVNLVKALKRSNDIYFYEVGRIIGEKALADWSKKLFLGSKLGIDLPGELEGLVPDDGWKRKTFDQVWYPGDTLHMAIGQGFILTTPLQILGITSYIAADGDLLKPQLLLKVESGGIEIRGFQPEVLASKLASKEQIDIIKQGLEEVPKDGGTAWPFFTFPIQTAGKTGTAEFGDQDKTHAWYTSYAPSEDPKIAITILIEGGGEGSTVASPIAKEVYRWYFSEDKNKLIQDTNNVSTESARTLGE